jgi:peptidoglycan/xylan/chitin deacetylase (PgdA/CDA1 family)
MRAVRTALLITLGILAASPLRARAETPAALAPAAVTVAPALANAGPAPAVASEPPACAASADVLGISRVVEIDAATGPRFGEQYPHDSFLLDHEIVLTFDDGPMRRYTLPILDALDEQCTKATFFSVGRMAIADPATLREVVRRGHTVGAHTWSHAKLKSIGGAAATREIELGLSAVAAASGAPIAPFFRFPYLADTKNALTYLQGRGIATFGIDVDSRDFRTRSPGTVLRNVVSQLEHKKKGIILFHDIQPSTAGALSSLLAELKAKGFKVVHVVAKAPAVTLPEYDAIAEKSLKAKAVAAAGDPLATRAVTWPVNAAGTPQTAGDPAAQDAKPARRATRKMDWSNPADDPWQLKSFGNGAGP